MEIKQLSQHDQEFLIRWQNRNLAILLGAGFTAITCTMKGADFFASLNWFYMMMSAAFMIVGPGSSEQKGSIRWVLDNLYMPFVINGALFFYTGVAAIIASFGTFFSAMFGITMILWITQIVLTFHDIHILGPATKRE